MALPALTTMVMSVIPDSMTSRTVCSITGLSPTISISFGTALVAGRSREPRPAAGMMARRMVLGIVVLSLVVASPVAGPGVARQPRCPGG